MADYSGMTEPRWQRCPECGGSGLYSSKVIRGVGFPTHPERRCHVCHGDGRAYGAWYHPHEGGRQFVPMVTKTDVRRLERRCRGDNGHGGG